MKNLTNNSMYRSMAQGYQAPNDDIGSGFNNNDLVIGGSGTGKTGGYVVPNLLNPYGNIIVSDTKGRLYKQTADYLREMGYEVMMIDFINPQNSMGYNPLAEIKNGSAGEACEIDIMTVASQLLPLSDEDRDAFWIENARTLIGFLMAFTLEAITEEEQNMATVLELFRMIKTEAGMACFEKWLMTHPDSYVSRMYDMIKGGRKAERTWECILMFARESLETFGYKELHKIFSQREDTFCVEDFLSKKSVLFINSSDSNRYADKIVSLFYHQLIHRLFIEADKSQNGRLERPVRLMIDDFAANVYIKDFDRLISVTRSRNIAVSVLLQNISQLYSRYDVYRSNTIISNCDHILYLGGQDLETAEYVAKRAGVTDEKILWMSPEKVYLIRRGTKALLLDRIPPYQELSERRKEKEEEKEREVEEGLTM